ncbi:hypothetical protein FJR45_09200 [Sulfurimonas sediminis]|uniref:Right-handed parallel beta-helix repeat-containing protein n=1 Tax=Sulfurimonas sediminis TaxID=2590020 RepID=A0A7M1B5S7_9BACT|nr:hypothetical protein [Sulfurimonas sediminis]QOP44108.1 hypothetical protein FJR45_09200 [Sulfurimonas sediminis]
MNKFKLITLSLVTATAIGFSGCGGGGGGTTDTTTPTPDTTTPAPDTTIPDANTTTPNTATVTKMDLSGDITADMTLTADKVWRLNGLVTVTNGATLTIEPGTVIIGKSGTGAATSYMIIDKGAKIIADGTFDKPIVFMSETAYDGGADEWGQWGGLTLIGKAGNSQVQPYEVNPAFTADSTDLADNSGVLRNVKILNSGITMEVDKEVNGLSMVGVGSGTVVENITVNKSDDDCIEIWGGTVNLTNVDVSECSDDHFDIDDGYSGTVTNLTIHQTTGNSGIEMSGNTVATFDNFDIYVASSAANTAKEGAIYFKKDGIGGHFKNGTVMYDINSTYAAIYSVGTADIANTSFTNVSLIGSNPLKFNGDPAGNSATDLQTVFTSDTTNKLNATVAKTDLSGDITADMTLTADKVWRLNGLVTVTNGATLTIEPGTVIIGKSGTGAATSYMIIDKGAKIIADGTFDKPIVFMSETAYDGGADEWGQWGGLTLIGKAGNSQVQPYEVNPAFTADSTDLADNSGVLRNVKILNSGITMEVDKEVNGLSMVGVGSGTVVENITVNKSDDDCIEIWGGTVNLTNVDVSECSDDHFDIDDGYSGTVTNLTIHQTTGNSGIEMSGNTVATFDNFDIYVASSAANTAKEGAIYFKKDGIGGHFKNGTVMYDINSTYAAIYSVGTADIANTSFENVSLIGSNPLKFNGDSATDLQAVFENGAGNKLN